MDAGTAVAGPEVAVDTCQHEDTDVRSVRCHLHMGWCGVCWKCGEKVHAPMVGYAATGKKVFRKTLFHSQNWL